MKDKSCLSNGTYCAYRPKLHTYQNDENDIITSGDKRFQTNAYTTSDHELLMENLREKCVYKIVAEID